MKLKVILAAIIMMTSVIVAKAENHKYQDVKNKIELFKEAGDELTSKELTMLLNRTQRHESNLKRLEMIKSLQSGYTTESGEYNSLIKAITDYTTEEERSYISKDGKEHKYWKSTYERDLNEIDKLMKYTDCEIRTTIITLTNLKGDVVKRSEHKVFNWK